jgi:hypothetical protein
MYDLDNPEVSNSFDNLNMKDILSSVANQYSETKNTAQNFDKIPSSYGDFKNIVFSGWISYRWRPYQNNV